MLNCQQVLEGWEPLYSTSCKQFYNRNIGSDNTESLITKEFMYLNTFAVDFLTLISILDLPVSEDHDLINDW